MLFWQFSNIFIYVKIVGKITDQHLSVWLFSNPGDKYQICPFVLHLFWNLSPGFENNYTLKCWFGIFPTIFTYIIMLENCQINISVYGCSSIQGTQFYSCWNLMKPGSQSGTYAFTICNHYVHSIYCAINMCNHYMHWLFALALCIHFMPSIYRFTMCIH